MEDQIDFYSRNPPSCIDGFDVEYTSTDNLELDGHGEEINPAFKLACECGNTELTILGHYWSNPETRETFFVSPLSAKCSECSIETSIFDIQKDGYDTVLGHGCYSAYGEGKAEPYKCASCHKPTKFEAIARFEYTDDLFDDDFEEARGREKELFTWFSLHGHCSSCSSNVTISEDECA